LIPIVDPATNSTRLQRLIQAHCHHFKPDTSLGLTELAKEVGVKADTLLYWERLGILQSIVEYKGERSVGKYPFSEIKKAFAARELQQKWGYKPSEIVGALAFFQGEPPQPDSCS